MTFRRSRDESDDDIHMRLMKIYPEVPSWWYHAVFLATVAMSLVVTQAYETHLPWWAFFLAIAISVMWFLPIGMIEAITNIEVRISLCHEG